MLAINRYTFPNLVPDSLYLTDYYNRYCVTGEVDYVEEVENYVNGIAQAMRATGLFTTVDIETTATAETKAFVVNSRIIEVPDNPDPDEEAVLLTPYYYDVKCYCEEDLFITFRVNVIKYKGQDSSGQSPYYYGGAINTEVAVHPRKLSYSQYFYFTSPGGTGYDGFVYPIDNTYTSMISEIIQIGSSILINMCNRARTTSGYIFAISKTNNGKPVVISASTNNIIELSYYNYVKTNPASRIISIDSEQTGLVTNTTFKYSVDASTTVLSYLPVGYDDDYVRDMLYAPISQITIDDSTGVTGACTIQLNGRKYFFTGYFAIPLD